MIKYNYGWILLMFLSFFISAKEGDIFKSNQLVIDDMSIFLTKKNKENILYINKVNKEGELVQCQIKDWDKDNANIYLLLTTDKKGILLNGTYFYLDSEQVFKCHNRDVILLHQVPVLKSDIYFSGTEIVDINFSEELYLSLPLIYHNSYQAVIAKFNSNKNLINVEVFRYEMDDQEKFELIDKDDSPSQYGIANGDIEDEGTFNGGYGAISLDGKYVLLSTTEKLDCSTESYPGLWDIKKKKKVNWSKNSKSLSGKIDDKQCHNIFNEITTLNGANQLGLTAPLNF